jgi:hypothetical protein
MTGILDGKDLEGPYRLVIEKTNQDEWLIRPEQAFKNKKTGEYKFNEYSGLPAWDLPSMIKNYPHDVVWIDMGQKWGIKGMQEGLKEASEKMY